VRQDFDVLGERAVAALVSGIEDAVEPRLQQIPVRLILRASTAPAPR